MTVPKEGMREGEPAGPKGPELSVEQIQNYTRELQERVERAKQERERSIKEKVSEHEVLIREAKQTAGHLEEAQNALDYFTAMKELGELREEKDKARLGELKKLVDSLRNRQEELDKRTAALYSRPEIQERLREHAELEDKERTARKLMESADQELLPKLNSIFEEIKRIVPRRESLRRTHLKEREELEGSEREKFQIIRKAEEMLRQRNKERFVMILEDRLRDKSPLAAYEAIKELRSELGMFRGTEKAALDSILKHKRLFGDMAKEQSTLDRMRTERNHLDNGIEALAKDYRSVILKGWEVSDQVAETEAFSTHGQSFYPSELSRYLEKLVDQFAQDTLQKAGKHLEKHESAYKARSRPENQELNDIYLEIIEKAGGAGLIYTHPREQR